MMQAPYPKGAGLPLPKRGSEVAQPKQTGERPMKRSDQEIVLDVLEEVQRIL
jgi:hypothetical protein